jgi:SAM-dependent methyltransferase
MRLAPIGPYDMKAWGKRVPKGCWVDRDEAVLELSRGKRVAHLGAADAPFHLEKARDGELLHLKVKAVAAELVGFDFCRQAVDELRAEFGVDDILITDATRPLGGVEPHSFDVVLCCDIIEHVSNVGGLLDTCRDLLRPDGQLVVTTINATALKPAVRAILSREDVHFEHTAYFSYSTLCQVLVMNGFVPELFGTFSYPTYSRAVGFFFRTVARFAPGTADGVLVTARPVAPPALQPDPSCPPTR